MGWDRLAKNMASLPVSGDNAFFGVHEHPVRWGCKVGVAVRVSLWRGTFHYSLYYGGVLFIMVGYL